jgi:hypothetical protein
MPNPKREIWYRHFGCRGPLQKGHMWLLLGLIAAVFPCLTPIRRGLLKVEQLHALARDALLRAAGPDLTPASCGSR